MLGVMYIKITRSAHVTRSARNFNLRNAIVNLREMYPNIQKVPQNGLKCVLRLLYNLIIHINMTLDNLIDDVLLEARNNNVAESEKLSRHLIELWIKSYRAQLIREELMKKKNGNNIDDAFTQTIRMHIDKVENIPGHIEYIGDKELPTLLNIPNLSAIVSVKDAYGNLIQFGSETKMKYQKYRKYTCGDYIAYKKDGYLYLKGSDNLIEYIDVKVIAEDPTEDKLCYDPSKDEYPLPTHMWPTIKNMIFNADIYTMFQLRSDISNNSNDDVQNTYNPNLYRNTRRR